MLLISGYWPIRYWPYNYWNNDYWPDGSTLARLKTFIANSELIYFIAGSEATHFIGKV